MKINLYDGETLSISDKNGHIFQIYFNEKQNRLLVYNYDIEELTPIKINKEYWEVLKWMKSKAIN